MMKWLLKENLRRRCFQSYLQGKVAPVSLENMVITGAGLGRGEIEAMALYKSTKADWLLLDDNRARKVARLNHIGLITLVRPYLERLRATDIRISERLIERTLALAGE